MLAQIAPLITRGVVDNTTPGYVELRLWGIDEGEPIDILLTGNCLADIAGCRVNFTNFPTRVRSTSSSRGCGRKPAPHEPGI